MITVALIRPKHALPAAKGDKVEEVEGDPILPLREGFL